MNFIEFLQRQAEKDAEKLLTEEDELFIQQIIQEIEERNMQEKTEKRKKKNNKASD